MPIGMNVGGDVLGAPELGAVPFGDDQQVRRTRALLGGPAAQAGQVIR